MTPQNRSFAQSIFRVWIESVKSPRHSQTNVRKFNRTQSKSIHGLSSAIEPIQIEHQTMCEFDFRTNRTQSNKSNRTELNPLDCVRLGLVAELNRTQSNRLHAIAW